MGEERGDGESVSVEGEGYGGAHERWNGYFAVEQSSEEGWVLKGGEGGVHCGWGEGGGRRGRRMGG